MNTCAGYCNTACTARATPQNWEDMRVARLQQGSTHLGNRARGRHHDWWGTIGSVLHQLRSRKDGIKKRVIGEDADLEKIRRILNRVDQRHVREILMDLELERANHAATPRNMDKKKEDDARRAGSKVENQFEQGRRQTKHDSDDAGDGHDKLRVQMISDERDDANDTGAGDMTKCRALVARISYLSQGQPDLKFASIQVCCVMANPSASDLERVKRIGRYLVAKPRAECLFHWQKSGELEAYSEAD